MHRAVRDKILGSYGQSQMLGSYGQSQMLGSYGQSQGNGVSLINLIQAKLPSMGIKANGNGSTLHRNIAELQINLSVKKCQQNWVKKT